MSRATRRDFIETTAGAAAAAWLTPVLRADATLLGTIPFLGEGSFPLDRTVGTGLGRRRALDLSTLAPASLLTSQDRFFIRTGCPDRLPSDTSWKVRVHGLVEAPLEVAIEDLRREAADMGPHLLECAGNSRAARFGLMSAARFAGVKLERLLERVRLRPRGTRVLVSGFDDHSTLDPGSVSGASWIFTLDEVRKAGAFLATGMNGAHLSPDHGHPLRLVVPGWYACTAIKWVNEIEIVDDEALATDHMREYAGRTHQDPSGSGLARDFLPATVDPAALPVRVETVATGDGRISYRIVGVVWGGRTQAFDLQIRLNPELRYAPVQKVEGRDSMPWTLWYHTLPQPAPGRYRIDLAVKGAAEPTRRLDAGFYAREIQILGA